MKGASEILTTKTRDKMGLLMFEIVQLEAQLEVQLNELTELRTANKMLSNEVMPNEGNVPDAIGIK